MPRPCLRVRLESGLKLDLNNLARRGFIRPGAMTGAIGIRWYNSYWDKTIATGIITADMSGSDEGWFNIEIGGRHHRIILVARKRHFGGRQWYFMCPYMNLRASVLWMPPGASYFACRQEWGRRVAYESQFLDRDNRAHRGQAKLRNRLCRIGGFDPDEWDLPPKPKWMRWKTYNHVVEKFNSYEDNLNEGILELLAKLKRMGL
jgi:hypothetical protein